MKSMAAAKVADSAVWQGEGDRSAEDWLARTTGTTWHQLAQPGNTVRVRERNTHGGTTHG